jgi:DNA repair photolyase
VSDKQKPEHLIKLNVIEPKSVLNAWGMGGFTLNPYTGCTVGCAYCYVPHMRHNQLEARKWGTYVDIKEGAVELLNRQLARLKKPTSIFMSTATDPYQPVEERYQITRRMLEVFERHPQHALFILTKQALVERDSDILVRLPRVAVGMSISVMDDALARLIEPWAPATSERLALIGRLVNRSIPTYILWAPVIVPAQMSEAFIHNSVAAIAQTGTGALSFDTLNYRSSQSAGLFRRLRRENHQAANQAQVKLIRHEADRRGLGHRLETVKPASMDDIAPMLPF